MSRAAATLQTTIREFRTAPTKFLRRAARTGAKLRLAEFVLEVREETVEAPVSTLYGAMASTGRVVGSASRLLSADDVWNADQDGQT